MPRPFLVHALALALALMDGATYPVALTRGAATFAAVLTLTAAVAGDPCRHPHLTTTRCLRRLVRPCPPRAAGPRGRLPRAALDLPEPESSAEQAAAGLARLQVVILRLRRGGSLPPGHFAGGVPLPSLRVGRYP